MSKKVSQIWPLLGYLYVRQKEKKKISFPIPLSFLLFNKHF